MKAKSFLTDRASIQPTSTPSPQKGRRRASSTTGVALALISMAGAFVLMYALHRGVHSLSYNQRIPVFLGFSALYLLWPLVAKIVPVQYLLAVCSFPLFGILLGLTYTSDIGPDSYMFEAQPPCFAGLWGVVTTAIIAYLRIR